MKIFLVSTFLVLLSFFIVRSDEIPEELRLQEYFCNRNLMVSSENHSAKFLRLRGLSIPQFDRIGNGTVEVEDFYEISTSRFREQFPYIKYVSIVADYEYSSNTSTDEEELRSELMFVQRWLKAVVHAFYQQKIRIVEFELYATLGFEDTVPLQRIMNKTFGQETPLSMDFCRISFNCDVKFPLGLGNGEATLSMELSGHLSRRPSGRRSLNSASCETKTVEDEADVHKIESYEYNADVLPLDAFQSKRLFYVQLTMPKSGSMIPNYEIAVRNFHRKLPNVEKIKLRGQTFITPRNASDESELKSQLRYLRHWAQLVVRAFDAENLDILTFDLVVTLRFDHQIDLSRVFAEVYNDDSPLARIDSFLSPNLFNAEIPLGNGKSVQAEMLLTGSLKRRRFHVAKQNLTLKQLFGR